MDKKIANNIVVGLFALLGFSAFIFVLFNIGGGTGFFQSEYQLRGRFPHVKGLHFGSEVSLSGLRVGTITKIDVDPNGSKNLIIELSIVKKVQQQIRGDSVAMIRTQGVLGDKYVELSIGSGEFPALKDGDWVETREEGDLFSKGGSLVEGIQKHFEEGGDVEQLLRNLTMLSKNLDAFVVDLRRKRVSEKLSDSLYHLESILKKVNNGTGTVGALINDPTLYEDTKSLIGGAERSSILKSFIRGFVKDGSKARKR